MLSYSFLCVLVVVLFNFLLIDSRGVINLLCNNYTTAKVNVHDNKIIHIMFRPDQCNKFEITDENGNRNGGNSQLDSWRDRSGREI